MIASQGGKVKPHCTAAIAGGGCLNDASAKQPSQRAVGLLLSRHSNSTVALSLQRRESVLFQAYSNHLVYI